MRVIELPNLRPLGLLGFLSTYGTNSLARTSQTNHQTSRSRLAFQIFVHLHASTNGCTTFQLSRGAHSSASTDASKPVQSPFISAADFCIALSRFWYLATRTRLFRANAAVYLFGPAIRRSTALHVTLHYSRNRVSQRLRHSNLQHHRRYARVQWWSMIHHTFPLARRNFDAIVHQCMPRLQYRIPQQNNKQC
jgi:hypothetical protein